MAVDIVSVATMFSVSSRRVVYIAMLDVWHAVRGIPDHRST